MHSPELNCLILFKEVMLFFGCLSQGPQVFSCSVGEGCGTYLHKNFMAGSKGDVTYGATHISGVFCWGNRFGGLGATCI